VTPPILTPQASVNDDDSNREWYLNPVEMANVVLVLENHRHAFGNGRHRLQYLMDQLPGGGADVTDICSLIGNNWLTSGVINSFIEVAKMHMPANYHCTTLNTYFYTMLMDEQTGTSKYNFQKVRCYSILISIM